MAQKDKKCNEVDNNIKFRSVQPLQIENAYILNTLMKVWFAPLQWIFPLSILKTGPDIAKDVLNMWTKIQFSQTWRPVEC